jgi:DNA-binding transcriptional MerR regulator
MGKQQEELLVTKSGAALIAGVTPAAIALAAREGRLVVAMTTANGIRLFKPEDVRAYDRNRRRGRGERIVAA